MLVESLSTHLRLKYGRMWSTRVVHKKIPARFNIYSQISSSLPGLRISNTQRHSAQFIALAIVSQIYGHAKYFVRNGSPIKKDKKGYECKKKKKQPTI